MCTEAKSLVCDVCWNNVFSFGGWKTVLNAKKEYEGLSYKTTWEAIHAAENCNWCQLLFDRSKVTKGDVEVSVSCHIDSDCTPAGDKMLTIAVRSNDVTSFHGYYMYTSPDDEAARYVVARDRVLDVASENSYKLALECIDYCDKNHIHCPKLQIEAILPDRVIDCSNVKKPKIVLTGGQMKGSYVALSYVWGGIQPTTLKENIDEFVSEGIDISKFRQTIRDAVMVTHSIGQRYLWIDALCTIQDSKKDFVHQLKQLQRIYQHSYLTISASCASNSREGFLGRERKQKAPNARIPYPCPDGKIGSVWIVKRNDPHWEELEPITHRAWCFQERVLPSRSLIFASDTLKYYCQTETVNIGRALCEPSTATRLPRTVYFSQSSGIKVSEADQIANRQSWLSVLFTYTPRLVSRPEYRLVALSGVAELFGNVFQSPYLAGLWKNTLILDLLWKNGLELFPRPKDIDCHAPSWSWASIDGLIETKYIDLRLASDTTDTQRAKILDCQVTLANKEVPYGAVTGGTLKIKGFVKNVILESRKGTSSYVFLMKDNLEYKKIGYTTFDAEEEVSKATCVVPILWDTAGKWVKGLAVTKMDDGTFRRIGYFENHDSVNAEWLEGLDEQEIVLV